MIRLPILTALAQKEDILDVVLNYAVWLIRFAVVTAAIPDCFCCAVCNLVPYYRRQIVQTEVARPHLYVGMQRCDPMPAFILSPWDADVAHDAANAPARHKNSRAFPPDIVQLG